MSTSASNRPQNVSRRGRHARGMGASRPELQAPLLFRFPTVETTTSLSELPDDENNSSAGAAAELSVSPEAQVAEAALSESVYSQAEVTRTAAYVPPPAPEVSDSTTKSIVDSTTNTEELEETEPEEQSTWWEHWSSGVVLLLLIAALVTAGIAAFNDRSETKDDLLAIEETQKAAAGNGELTQLDIPLGDTTTTPAYPEESALVEANDSQESLIPSIDGTVAPLPNTPPIAEQGLELDGGQGFVLGVGADDGASTESLVSNEEIEQALSQATLGLPEQRMNRPMFDDSSATTPDTQMQPLENVLGMQPAAGTAGVTPPLPSATESSQTLTYPSMGVGATTVSHAVPVSEPANTSVQPAIRQTQTPASDEQELLRRFQEWRKSQQATTTTETSATQNSGATPSSGANPAGYPPN